MTNIERLKMAIEGIDMDDNKLLIYLEENTLISTSNYNPQSNSNKKSILKTALSILEDIANNPQIMKNYKNDDITISNFAENLQNRIDQLEKKIRQIPDDDLISTNNNGSNFIYMFTN
ncbi:DNA polymerase II small subunit/DNA polymerase delta subunit B [Clostridium pascui]|uniref:hypothetical protein n=1 Tax=Clostridium pascui TaxID=46609 RepID=UPI00195AC997|nr:hypothetical protein [Clostridium pascui]MBM7869224.1 DNA polymerase II small subunit/DNA polymerase delta subunit B [Clostridium pascui]